ncbi:[protein-PII] uridylyltransferase [Acidihalobacter ferrooxydans]|uniref:Bifunctional uridylyltransferase/uridylyl-removing enzyme n=1 Tax=Acidihalobacter ferrooxydans TaxID=1765967 RepID=A0A1P8UHD9_9GAMM|nr:[protein-PII] uridylyltransferase [Acidihalobacter ferrooxydans]APZ43240.1 [protein-PII] uridylyltransferase [Acidihalobacter ferrooxydans]
MDAPTTLEHHPDWPPTLATHYDLDTAEQRFCAAADKIAAGREIIQAATAAIADAFAAGVLADDLVHGRAAVLDRILRACWQHVGLSVDGDLALIAVGGYGRGELLPASDIDLLLLCTATPDEARGEAISTFIRLLWDMGLHVGHSVRTLNECEDEAIRDVTVVTNLMEARLLAGNEDLYDLLEASIAPERIWPSREFFSAKLDEQARRHRKFGDSAYGLEPNVKDGPGGLRDIQMIGWVSKRHLHARRMSELVHHGFLTDEEYHELKAGQSYLWRVRFALHTLAGRGEDRLLFDQQRALADLFGYHDATANLAIEQFMQTYYRTVMRLERLNEMLLQHYKEAILYATVTAEPEFLNDHFQVSRGFIEVRYPQVFSTYPPALLELFLLSAQHPHIEGVRASTIRLLRQHRHLIDETFRNDLICRNLFMQILRQPHGVTTQLRRMNRYGILAAYLPAFALIVGRMQYDLFHVYTVDEHTLMVLRNVRRYSFPELADDTPGCAEIFARVPAPEVLYLAALFHDIAQGRGGDHSELGARDAEDFCRLHGLPEDQVALVSWLVRNHLMMSMTAQRKDISDPDIVLEFARKVGTQRYLDHIYLLTIADIRATNPNPWNSWRQSLLAELHRATTSVFKQGLETPQSGHELIAQVQIDALRLLREQGLSRRGALQIWEDLSDDYFLRHSADEISWHTRAILEHGAGKNPVVRIRAQSNRGGSEICIYAPEAQHVFAHVTSTLDRLGLDIVEARITSARRGMVLDTFIILEEDGAPVSEDFRLNEITSSLRTTLADVNATPAEVKRRLPRRLRHFQVPTQIHFSHAEGQHWSAIQLTTGDRPGLLSAIGQALIASKLRIHNARITTIGAQADDIFYVTEEDDSLLTDTGRQAEVKRAILQALDANDAA